MWILLHMKFFEINFFIFIKYILAYLAMFFDIHVYNRCFKKSKYFDIVDYKMQFRDILLNLKKY